MKATTTRLWTWTRWAPLLALTATLAACGAAVTPQPTAAPAEPADRQPTCADSAINLPDLAPGVVHGAIVSDTLHMGGATAPATCMEPANQSLEAGVPTPAGTEQAQQSQSRYYLIVINYPGGNRLYVITRRADGTTCVVDTNDQCIAQVTELPDDFDLKDLPEDVAPTIPAGRPAPPTVSPPPAGGDTPAPPGGDGAPAPEPGTPPGAASSPQPSDGATGVDGWRPVLLSWSATPRALSYELYWGSRIRYLDGTPISTASTFVTIANSVDLIRDRTYYWRVDAKNEAGTTRGAVWSFTTAADPPPRAATGPPGAARNPSPYNGAPRVPADRPNMNWSAAPRALSYDVYYGTTKELSADTERGTPINTSSAGVENGTLALAHETLYYWRVDVKNEEGTTRGTVWSFTTAAAPPPPPPPPTPLESIRGGAFPLVRMSGGGLGAERGQYRVNLSGWTRSGVFYRIRKVVFEMNRLEIEVTPSASAEHIEPYYVQVGGRLGHGLVWTSQSPGVFAFSEARFTSGDASNPDVYEWGGPTTTLFPSFPTWTVGDRMTLQILKPSSVPLED